MPEANHDYWTRKIARNVERDKRNLHALHDLGWESRIIWECELKKDIEFLIADLRRRASSDAGQPLPP